MNGAGATLGGLGLADLPHLGPAPDGATPVSGLCVDSRETRPGFVFAALSGENFDGAAFAQYAVRMGAVAVIASREGAARARADIGDFPVPFLIDEAPRRRLALTAAAFYRAQPETMVAVTGTNGKTSIAAFTRQIWTRCGRSAVNFGTVGVEGAVSAPLSMTTPEPIALHGLLAEIAAAGATHAAMEASSHGLAQHRLDGVRLAAGAFSNLTRDHLDYHATPEAYLAAKRRLFGAVLPEGARAVLNVDDPACPAFAEAARARGLRILPFGRSEAAASGLRLLEAAPHSGGLHLTVEHAGARRALDLPLIGGFQALNALAAAGLALATGEAADAVFAALARLEGVRGRMERVARRRNGAEIFVDFAHTPDGVSTALAALRPHAPQRIVAVVGAGGDRDPGKRPLMGRAAAEGADAVIVTDDNPRTEDPAAIRAAVMAGAPDAEEIGGRAEAILAAVDALGPEDRLLIAGKGHETGQIIGDQVIPFDDAEQARAAVAALDGLE